MCYLYNTAVERLFSDNGNTITSRRTRLQTSKVNQLLFIRRNLSILRELFPPSLEQLNKKKNSITSTTLMKKPKHLQEKDDDNSILLDDLLIIAFLKMMMIKKMLLLIIEFTI
jgi:hypothetical protein